MCGFLNKMLQKKNTWIQLSSFIPPRRVAPSGQVAWGRLVSSFKRMIGMSSVPAEIAYFLWSLYKFNGCRRDFCHATVWFHIVVPLKSGFGQDDDTRPTAMKDIPKLWHYFEASINPCMFSMEQHFKAIVQLMLLLCTLAVTVIPGHVPCSLVCT